MRYFILQDFQYWALALFIGLGIVVLAGIGWGAYRRDRDKEIEDMLSRMDLYEILSRHDIEKNPLAPVLIFVYTVTILWAIGYMIFFGMRGTFI